MGRKAIEVYQEVIKNNPKNDKAYLLLGTLYAQEGRFLKALDTLDHLKELYPGNPIAPYYKGRVFLDMKLYDKAETAYREALEMDPLFESALLDLAYVYEVTERPRKAEETYLQTPVLQPQQRRCP